MHYQVYRPSKNNQSPFWNTKISYVRTRISQNWYKTFNKEDNERMKKIVSSFRYRLESKQKIKLNLQINENQINIKIWMKFNLVRLDPTLSIEKVNSWFRSTIYSTIFNSSKSGASMKLLVSVILKDLCDLCQRRRNSKDHWTFRIEY